MRKNIFHSIIIIAALTACIEPVQAQNVGIGTSTPQSRLHVTGKITTDSLRITGGAAAGKLLSSTPTGDAEWTTPAFITTGLNGLVRAGDTLQLGGHLVHNTIINTAGNRLNLAKLGNTTSGIVGSNMASFNFYSSGNNFQTFEVVESCRLDSIQVYFLGNGATSCIAQLSEGEGLNTSYLGTTAPFSYPASVAPTPYTLVFPNVNLETNKKYALRLIDVVGWVGNNQDPYPLGLSNNGPTNDFLFVVYGTYSPFTGLVVQQSGEVNIRGRLSLNKQTALDLGAGENKGPNAGVIGYQLFTPDALDIVGAGTEDANRKIKFWAEGGTSFNGPITGPVSFTSPVDAVLTQDAVQAPTLLNGWINHGGSFADAGYWKDREGMVHLRGLITNGNIATNTILFMLPAGYRPATRLIFNVNAGNLFGRVDILPTGEVIIAVVSSNAFLNLEGILFRTN